MRFLIIHPSFLGDAVFLGPGIRALKSRWPQGWVGICLTPRGAPVGELLPGCDEVLVYDKRGKDRGLAGLLRVGRRARTLRPDIALISHPSMRSGILGWLSWAPRRVGYAPFCTERLPFPKNEPFTSRLLRCAAHVGAGAGEATLALRAPDQDDYVRGILSGVRPPIVGLVPGAEQPTKRWGAAAFGELGFQLRKRGATVVLLGGPSERNLAEEVRARAELPAESNLAGNSVRESLAVLSRCDVVVGGDTGLVHCARGLGVPVAMIFGPTPVARHVFAERQRAVHLSLDCQPCHRSGQLRCPLGHHRCMVDLSVAAVERIVSKLCPQLALTEE